MGSDIRRYSMHLLRIQRSSILPRCISAIISPGQSIAEVVVVVEADEAEACSAMGERWSEGKLACQQAVSPEVKGSNPRQGRSRYLQWTSASQFLHQRMTMR